jgi:predicted AlkP superfamily phosphohydrolase/phosphomutase
MLNVRNREKALIIKGSSVDNIVEKLKEALNGL